MRVPGWLFILGVVLFVGLTALFSALSFNGRDSLADTTPDVGMRIELFSPRGPA